MSDVSKMSESDWLREVRLKNELITAQSQIIVKLRTALLNIDGTARKWATAKDGDTPLAIIAEMARGVLGVSTEQADAEIKQINTPAAAGSPR